jgi:hypothetical protein
VGRAAPRDAPPGVGVARAARLGERSGVASFDAGRSGGAVVAAAWVRAALTGPAGAVGVGPFDAR